MERFYYLYLNDALRERGMSDAGMYQLESFLPITNEKDRTVTQTSFFNSLKFEQRAQRIIDIMPEHIRHRFVELGFSQLGITEFYNNLWMTNIRDRMILFKVLTDYFVRNEAMVPQGYRSDMKNMWRANEIKRHGES